MRRLNFFELNWLDRDKVAVRIDFLFQELGERSAQQEGKRKRGLMRRASRREIRGRIITQSHEQNNKDSHL